MTYEKYVAKSIKLMNPNCKL